VGTLGATGVVVLEGLAGLCQRCGGSGVRGATLGEVGSGIRVAIRRISSQACRNSSSIFSIFLWWSAAHNSTLPWKVGKCYPWAVLASPRNASASFTRVSWVAWHIWHWLSSAVRSMIACQTFSARVWYAFATWASSVRTQASTISSLAFTRSYTYLVPSANVLYACSIHCIH